MAMFSKKGYVLVVLHKGCERILNNDGKPYAASNDAMVFSTLKELKDFFRLFKYQDCFKGFQGTWYAYGPRGGSYGLDNKVRSCILGQ